MLKPFAFCAALAAASLGPTAFAAEGPPIAGSVADFSRIDPSLPAPDDGFVDASGHKLTLADFHGKFLLLNLWATWCGPCVAEMPSLDHLQMELGGTDFLVLPVSVDRGGLGLVTGFYNTHRISHLGVYVDSTNQLAQHMSVRGIPTSFLVGRDGRVVGALVGATDWDTPEALALIAYYLKSGAPAPPLPTAPAPTPQVTPTSLSLPMQQAPAQRVGTGLGPL